MSLIVIVIAGRQPGIVHPANRQLSSCLSWLTRCWPSRQALEDLPQTQKLADAAVHVLTGHFSVERVIRGNRLGRHPHFETRLVSIQDGRSYAAVGMNARHNHDVDAKLFQFRQQVGIAKGAKVRL